MKSKSILLSGAFTVVLALVIALIPEDTFILKEKIWLYGEITILQILSIVANVLCQQSGKTDSAYFKVTINYILTGIKFLVVASIIAAYAWTHKENLNYALMFAMMFVYIIYHILITRDMLVHSKKTDGA